METEQLREKLKTVVLDMFLILEDSMGEREREAGGGRKGGLQGRGRHSLKLFVNPVIHARLMRPRKMPRMYSPWESQCKRCGLFQGSRLSLCLCTSPEKMRKLSVR